MKIAILFFAYKRLLHMQRAVESLIENDCISEFDVCFYIDGPKSEKDNTEVLAVRQYIMNLDGFTNKYVFASNVNKGLAESIIYGVTSSFEKYDAVIVLEDDLILRSDFLTYMRTLLHHYENDERITSVSGFSPLSLKCVKKLTRNDLYFHHRSCSWGWATWKSRWGGVDWALKYWSLLKSDSDFIDYFSTGGEDLFPMLNMQVNGVVDSWSIRFTLHHYLNYSLAIYPADSRVMNIGKDGSGTHFTKKKKICTDCDWNEIQDLKIPSDVELNSRINYVFRRYFYTPKWKRLIVWLLRKLK